MVDFACDEHIYCNFSMQSSDCFCSRRSTAAVGSPLSSDLPFLLASKRLLAVWLLFRQSTKNDSQTSADPHGIGVASHVAMKATTHSRRSSLTNPLLMAEEKESVASMPDGWPVSFNLPEDPASRKEETVDLVEEDKISKTEYASLQPGPCLQACNGSDIQLARGASSRPNLAKGKGRYLIILPGMMSLKPQAKATKTPVKDATRDAGHAEPDDLSQAEEPSQTTREDIQKDSAESESDTEQAKPDAASSDPDPAKREDTPKRPTSFVAKGVTLGKIEKLATVNPILKVPFGDGRTLVFQGKKIDSSSKFMMFNCKSSKGSVTCKDIFSSAIVFGEATWENENAETNVAQTENGNEIPFRHYGGSVRTVDGGKSTKSTFRTVDGGVSIKKPAKRRPSVSKTAKEKVEEDDEMEFESESEENKKSPEKAIDVMNDGSDSEESWSPGASKKRKQASDYVETTEPAAKRAPRSRSARKASEKAKQKMGEENDDTTSEDEVVAVDNDEEFEEDKEDELELEEQKATLAKVDLELLIEESWSPEASGKQQQASDSDVETTEPAAKRAPRCSSSLKASEKAKQKMVEENDDSMSEDKVVVLDDSEEFEDDKEEESDPEENATRRGRKSNQKATPAKSRASEDQASDSDVETPGFAAKRAPRSRSSRKASEKAKQKMEEKIGDNTSEDEVVVLDDDDEFEDDDEDESEYEETTTRRGRKSSQKATPAKSQAKSRSTIDVDLTKENDEDSTTRKPKSRSRK